MTLFWVVAWWLCALRIAWSAHRTGSLARVAPAQHCPSLTVVVAARNEAATLRPAVESLLALDYPDLQVVVVDDRSDDGTGAVLSSLHDSRLTVVRLDHLPEGWLGKTHALWKGAQQARGDLLLFTDADVVFTPDCLRRAVTALEGLDHLVLGPSMLATGLWEKLFVSYFGAAFCLRFQPERAEEPDPRLAMGIGAFNLVRRSAYERCDGYRALRLHVLDDMALGRVLKRNGYRQRYLDAHQFVQVRWIRGGLRAVVHGLEKNAYAGMGYQPVLALGAALVFGAAGLSVPLIDAWGRPLVLGAMLFISRLTARTTGAWPVAGLGYPLAALLMGFVIARSALLAEVRGGIYWRGTFYPLSLLRRHTLEAL